MNKKKILIIDDEKDLCDLMKLNIEAKGEFDVVVAYSGEEGIEKIQKLDFDAVITDFSMPGMNGEEVVNLAKKIKPKLPILLFSIYHDDDSMLTKDIKSKADGLVHKPIDQEQLYSAIHAVLTKAQEE
jgi:CheY-like chemotaxis protein